MQYSIDDMAELLGDNCCCTLCSMRFDVKGCECNCKTHIKKWLETEECLNEEEQRNDVSEQEKQSQ